MNRGAKALSLIQSNSWPASVDRQAMYAHGTAGAAELVLLALDQKATELE
jgi:hypothetical protein